MNEFEFRAAATFFLEDLFQQFYHNKIEIESYWDIDHLCFRVETENEYQKIKTSLLSFSRLLVESPVQGRLISTFELRSPIVFKDRVIALVELPAPKIGKVTKTGFEHIEVVCSLSFEELKEKYIHLKIDEKGLQKTINREFEIELNGASVKFHHSSLATIIRLEQNIKVFDALMKSGLLQNFHDCDPLVAGTFPLGLETDQSDIDLLLYAHNLEDIELRLRNLYQKQEQFHLSKFVLKNIPVLLCQFKLEDVPFEIFVQAVPTVRQDAQRHLVVEERLLKLGGDLFREKVQKQRTDGHKTEDAFVRALGLSAQDPFQLLLDYYFLTDSELKRILSSSAI